MTKSSLAEHRANRKRAGMVRVELQVHKDDVHLLRSVAGALADPQRAAETRSTLRERVVAVDGDRLKALLASAPLDGIDLTRDPDTGREVEL